MSEPAGTMNMAANLSANLTGISLSEDGSPDEYIPTPSSREGDSPWGDEDDIVASWNHAIKQCKENLSEFDFAELRRFPSPEKLTEDLREKEASRPNLWHVRRPIRTMKAFFTFFVVTMSPRTVESSIFWGLLYLLVELADDQKSTKNRWNATKEMLDKVTRSLDACKRSHEGVPFDDDMRFALNDAFIALITLWAEAVAFMRLHPFDDVDDMPSKFDKAIKKVDESFGYLKELSASRHSNSKRTSFASEQESLQSLLPEALALPCGGPPLYDDETFLGRQSVLDNIHSVLSPGSGKVRKFCTVWGLGGVGKSKVALAYAKRYGDQYEVTIWFKSQNLITLGQSFTEVAIELRVPGADKNRNADRNRELLFDYLKAHGRRWLVIWDNVEKQSVIRPFLSITATASTLVTTRYPQEAHLLLSRGPQINLKPFSPSVSMELFTKLLGPGYLNTVDEREAADILLKKLGGLAIGICTMAVRIQVKNSSIRNFLNRYRKDKVTISGEAELPDYDLTPETLWNSSFLDLQRERDQNQTEAFTMLGILAFCSPDAIPMELFVGKHLTKLSDVPNFCFDSEEYMEAMDPLNAAGLITADRDFKGLAIHRLVQSAFRKFLGFEACQTAFDLTVRLVHIAFPKQIEGRPLHREWEQCRLFIQHGAWLADVYEESQFTPNPLRASKELGALLSHCIWYLVEIGEGSESLRISNIALKAVKEGSYLHGNLNNSMYGTYWFQNNLGRARTHLEVALRSMKEGIGELSEEYIGIISNEGNLLASEGRTNEALSRFLKVEQVRNQSNYPPNIGLAFINLGIGRLELLQGNTEEAERRFLKASQVIKDQHGERGQFMEVIHYEYGNLYLKKGEYLLAESSYAKGIELQELQNPSHMFIACFLYKQACAKMMMRDLANAKVLLERALDVAVLYKSEGQEARIVLKMAALLRLMGSTPDDIHLLSLEKRAKGLKDKVENEFGLIPRSGAEEVSEEEEYSHLVCVIYR